MIDAHAVEYAIGVKLKDQRMDRLEHLVIFDSECGEFVDIEEAAPVDFIVGGTPRHQPVMLLLKQKVQALSTGFRSGIKIVVGILRPVDGAFRKWKKMIEISNVSAAIFAMQIDLPGGKRFTVRPAQNRHGDLAMQLTVRRFPIDVEIFRESTDLPVPQNVHPPRILRPDRHVIGDDVGDDAKSMALCFVRQPAQSLLAAEFRIDTGGIDYVVAVLRSGARGEDWRKVQMRHAERRRVRNLRCSIVEREPAMKLQTQGGAWRCHLRCRSASGLSR